MSFGSAHELSVNFSRIPMLQGPTFTFVPPMLAMIKMEEYQCPTNTTLLNTTLNEVFDSRMQIVYKETFIWNIL